MSLRHYGEPVLRVATDGSSLGNPGPSGWAWVTENGQEAWAGARRSTNKQEALLVARSSPTLIAEKTGLPVRTVSRILAGKKPAPTTAEQLWEFAYQQRLFPQT